MEIKNSGFNNLNNFSDNGNTCIICKNEDKGVHCYGKNDSCTCSCRVIEARRRVKNFFQENKVNINKDLEKHYFNNPEKFIEKFLNKFFEEEFDSNELMFSKLSKVLNKTLEKPNLNTVEEDRNKGKFL